MTCIIIIAFALIHLRLAMPVLLSIVVSVGGLHRAIIERPVARADLRELQIVVRMRGVFGLVWGIGVLVMDGGMLGVEREVLGIVG